MNTGRGAKRGRERKRFKNVHCHCSVDFKSLKSTAQKETAGGRAVLAAKAVAQLFSLVQVSVIPVHLTKRERKTHHTAHLKPQLFYITYIKT